MAHWPEEVPKNSLPDENEIREPVDLLFKSPADAIDTED